MKKYRSLVLLLSSVLILGLFFLLATCLQVTYGQDGNNLPDPNELETVMIALTRLDVNDLITDVDGRISDVNDQVLDVNDQTLEIRWKIKNNLDQDVWICNGVGWIEDDDDFQFGYEAYLEDNNTLVLRRRLDVPTFIVYYIWPQGLYVRLRAGEERSESLSLKLPVRHNRIFMPALEKPGIIFVRRLVIELGYHTKDLAQIILDSEDSPEDPNMYTRVIIPTLSSLNEGESVLQITVDGVHIPYEEMWVGYTNAQDGP